MRNVRYHLTLCALRLVAALPFALLYRLSDITYIIIRYVLHYRQSVVMGNLTRSFPEMDGRQVQLTANRFYRHLSDCIFETVKLLTISDKQLERHIRVQQSHLIERLSGDGRPVVLFLGHYGNWEWTQEVTRHYRRPAMTCEVYRPLKDQAMDMVLSRIRARFATTPIPQRQAVRQLLRMNSEGRQFLVGFVADQRPNSKNLHHWTTWLHQDTAFATGGEEIGRRLNAHFVFLQVEKPRRGHYVMTFQEMTVDESKGEDYPYTLEFLRLMEASIRKAPELWLWSHNRWEFDREGNTIHNK